MDLEFYRTKRRVIKIALEQKHNEWLELASNGEYAAADVCQKTISKLAEQHEQCMADIARVKQELINAAS